MRVCGVVSGLRLVAVGNLVAGVPIAFPGHAVDAVRRDALFQLFYLEYYWFFHNAVVVFVVVSPAFGLRR